MNVDVKTVELCKNLVNPTHLPFRWSALYKHTYMQLTKYWLISARLIDLQENGTLYRHDICYLRRTALCLYWESVVRVLRDRRECTHASPLPRLQKTDGQTESESYGSEITVWINFLHDWVSKWTILSYYSLGWDSCRKLKFSIIESNLQ